MQALRVMVSIMAFILVCLCGQILCAQESGPVTRKSGTPSQTLLRQPNNSVRCGVVYMHNLDGDLYTVDITTGVATLIGPTGSASDRLLDIAIHGSNLYGVRDSDDFISIDPATGASTVIGSTGHTIVGLAADPTTGIMYGAGDYKLYTIDLATGNATALSGSFQFPVSGDLAFNADASVLYASLRGFAGDVLATVDKTTDLGLHVLPRQRCDVSATRRRISHQL